MTEANGTWQKPVRMSEIIPGVLVEVEEAQRRAEQDQVLAEFDDIRANEARAKEIEGQQVCPGCGNVEPKRDQLATNCPSCGTAYPAL